MVQAGDDAWDVGRDRPIGHDPSVTHELYIVERGVDGRLILEVDDDRFGHAAQEEQGHAIPPDDVVVFEAGREKKIVAENLMPSSVYGTISTANGVMYIMTRNELFAIQEGAQLNK
jgi:hypothetical protein